ncbi:MAG: SGNH/GDSL hydrolase family protein [Planctomycetes bacterium]|nr:SGNH/GDSL hydrolase family protein [Planctomycetota bacterium]
MKFKTTLTILLILAAANISKASNQIVVFGDSWGVPFAPALQQVLDDNGYGGVSVINAAFGGETASDMSSASPSRGLPYITSVLNANPDAELVHLSIGGNDALAQLSAPSWSSIYDDISTIVNHILSIRPDIQVYHTAYDYFPASISSFGLNYEQANAIFAPGATEGQLLADATPRMTFYDARGLMQTQFGIPELGIPANDPSLPDPTLPSPAASFADPIHLTTAGYAVFAQEAFDVFYESQLSIPEPSTLLLGVMAGVGLLARRRRGR